jgi:hypothetical protein
LHFENKNYFNVNLKQFAFEILQLFGYFLFWKRDYLLLCLAMRSFGENMSWDDLFVFIGFQSEGLEKKLEVLFEKNNLSLFKHSFLSAWIIMSSLFLMSWILWKSILCILRALFIVLGHLLAWLERTSTGT